MRGAQQEGTETGTSGKTSPGTGGSDHVCREGQGARWERTCSSPAATCKVILVGTRNCKGRQSHRTQGDEEQGQAVGEGTDECDQKPGGDRARMGQRLRGQPGRDPSAPEAEVSKFPLGWWEVRLSPAARPQSLDCDTGLGGAFPTAVRRPASLSLSC